MDSSPSGRLAGEAVDVLLEAVSYLRTGPARHGMVPIEARMPAEIAAPFWRAVLRVEAELLLHDADSVTSQQLDPPRTEEQRRADAFTALCLRLADAADPGVGASGG